MPPLSVAPQASSGCTWRLSLPPDPTRTRHFTKSPVPRAFPGGEFSDALVLGDVNSLRSMIRGFAGCPLLGLFLMFSHGYERDWAFKISFASFLSLKSAITLFYTLYYYSDNHFNLVANDTSERVSTPIDSGESFTGHTNTLKLSYCFILFCAKSQINNQH